MIAAMVTTFMNSAKKKSENRSELYSVWKPPTSSCSASTKSKGGRLSSAVPAMRNTTNGMNPSVATFQLPMSNPSRLKPPVWVFTISLVLSEPLVRNTAASESPSAASYDTICAEARTEPRSGYFEPDDHPASMTP